MNFKDQLKKDLDVFINPMEFGEIHTLGNKEVTMIVEEDTFEKINDRADEFSRATENIYESITVIYLKASDYQKPAVGKRITLDGDKYYVVGASISDGILKINLSANESYG
ncbi:hypothetical protein [Bacillus sp. B-jedd]|uniref:hypothetical protein n=1 Tax=Bacillus sp. B-jedd TaxID=1476857 RepID=UPI0005156551|nr:hypothetical protein [Bacillus sp. B-jedd]CEG29802.1 hypothetical protein BN1002_04763 [Bacillus sp. B-jedd]